MNNTVHSGFNFRDYQAPKPKSILDGYQDISLTGSSYEGGLAQTAANAPVQPSWADRFNALETKVGQQTLQDSPVERGPSRRVADITAVGGLGLGLAGFLDSRKTAQLQRSALRQDIAATKEYNDRKRANIASWNQAFANTNRSPNTQP